LHKATKSFLHKTAKAAQMKTWELFLRHYKEPFCTKLQKNMVCTVAQTGFRPVFDF